MENESDDAPTFVAPPKYDRFGDVWQGFVIDEQASAEPPGSERLLDTPSRR